MNALKEIRALLNETPVGGIVRGFSANGKAFVATSKGLLQVQFVGQLNDGDQVQIEAGIARKISTKNPPIFYV